MNIRNAYLNVDDIAINHTSTLDEMKRVFKSHEKKNAAIIIGMGPGGLATAITLQEKDYDVLIIEKRNTFTRSNIIGINNVALGWFKEHGLLNELLINSNKTLNYPSNAGLQTRHETIEESAWLEMTSRTANTISIKSLQAMLLKKFVENGGYSLIDTAVDVESFDRMVLRQAKDIWSIDLTAIDLVIAADGAQSQTREKLNVLEGRARIEAVTFESAIPTHYFSNMIITPKPEGLAPSVYPHTDSKTGFKMAFSVSETDISLNFQTSYSTTEGNDAMIARLLDESKSHTVNFLHNQNQLFKLSGDETFYPINGGKIMIGFNNSTFNQALHAPIMSNAIFETPPTRSNQMVYANKFILIGDAKGTSSPMAGLGASLAIAYDPVVIAKLAVALKARDDARENLFNDIEQELINSINVWHKRTMNVLNIDNTLLSKSHTSLWRKVNKKKIEHQAVFTSTSSAVGQSLSM